MSAGAVTFEGSILCAEDAVAKSIETTLDDESDAELLETGSLSAAASETELSTASLLISGAAMRSSGWGE